MSTLVAAETAVRGTKQAIQILGGNGYTREYPVECWHRDAKIFTIFEAMGIIRATQWIPGCAGASEQPWSNQRRP